VRGVAYGIAHDVAFNIAVDVACCVRHEILLANSFRVM